MRRRVTLDSLPLFRSAAIFSVRLRPDPDTWLKGPRAGQQFEANTASEATAMTKCLLYMAPIVLIGLVTTEAPAASAARAGSMSRNITATAPEGTGVPLGLVCQRGGRGGGGARAGGGGYRGGGARAGGGGYRGGGGARAGGGGYRGGGGRSWAGAGRGNFSGANANRGNFSGANV